MFKTQFKKTALFFSVFCLVLGFFVTGVTFTASAQQNETDLPNLNVLDKTWTPNKSSDAIMSNKLLKTLFDAGVQISPLGNEFGYDGWLTHKDGNIEVFYTTPNSDAVLSGTLISKDGENITALQLFRYEKISGNALAKEVEAARERWENMPESEKFFMEVEQALWFGYGGKEDDSQQPAIPYLYVFATPNCQGCEGYFSELLDKFAASDIFQIRAIPVSSNDVEKRLVAKIFSHERAAEQWMLMLLGTNDTKWDEIEAANRATGFVEGNNAVLARRNLDTYPLTVYKNARGEIKIVKGIPKSLDDLALDLIVQQ